MGDLPQLVLDSSVAIALIRGEASAPSIRVAIREWAAMDRSIVVPSVFWLEFVNPLARRHGYSSQELLQAVHEVDDLDLTTIELDRTSLLLTIDHIERHGLTAYGAHYLALANQLDAELATLDSALAAAAGDRAIAFGGHRLNDTPAVYEHDVSWPKYKGASAYLARLRAETRGGRAG
jgi:predicted nucleic acid-binding protein